MGETMPKLPIWKNRECLGHASSIEGARRVILAAQSLPNNAFTLAVWERPKHIQEILGLPSGYVFSWRYGGKK